MSPAIWLKWAMSSEDPAELAVVWDYAIEHGLVCLHRLGTSKLRLVNVPLSYWNSLTPAQVSLNSDVLFWYEENVISKRRGRTVCKQCVQE